jgi:hypothetical protein
MALRAVRKMDQGVNRRAWIDHELVCAWQALIYDIDVFYRVFVVIKLGKIISFDRTSFIGNIFNA